jgi:hypothetical protein
MPDEGIEVPGLRLFARELKQAGPDLVDELKELNYKVATKVRDAALLRAQGEGPMAARAAGSLRAARQAARAAVFLGNAKTPFALGAEFGSGRNKLRMLPNEGGDRLGWNQFKPWRGSGQGAGYFLYPAIRDTTPEIVDMYGDAVEQIARKAFPEQ